MVTVENILDIITNKTTGELTVDRRLVVVDSTTGEIYFDTWLTDADNVVDLSILHRPVKGIDSSLLDDEITLYC